MSFQSNQKLFKALSNETSHKIIILLAEKDYCACEIPSLISRTQSNTSMHLKKLSEDGILKNKRLGKKIIYSIKDRKLIQNLKDLKLV